MNPESGQSIPRRIEKPWGNELEFVLNEPCTVKIEQVLPGEAMSLQTHEGRDEFWRVLEGEGTLIIGDSEYQATVHDEYFIPRGTKHRIIGGAKAISVLEIAFGEWRADDIVHLEDKYGRT